MEHRVSLTDKEAFDLFSKLVILEVYRVTDEYTGEERIKTDERGTQKRDYKTPVKGVVHRFTSLSRLGEIENIWFEFKWTKNKKRFAVEFEGDVPDEYKKRPNIPGWDILKNA